MTDNKRRLFLDVSHDAMTEARRQWLRSLEWRARQSVLAVIAVGLTPTQAPDDVIREEIRTVNKKARDGGALHGPNVKQLYQLVRRRIEARNFDMTRGRFEAIADEAEFKSQRGKVGRRRVT